MCTCCYKKYVLKKSRFKPWKIAQLVKNPPAMQSSQFDSWVGKIHWRMDRLPTPVSLVFPCGSAGKESTFNVGNLYSIPGLGRSPGEGKGYALQYSGLENSMQCIVHGVAKSRHDWVTFTHFTHAYIPSLWNLLPSHPFRLMMWHFCITPSKCS